jgi:hypothetical protein
VPKLTQGLKKLELWSSNPHPKNLPPNPSPPKKESSEPLEDKIYKHIHTIPLE